MNILILGCGEVGLTCAKTLLAQHNITSLILHCKSAKHRTHLSEIFAEQNAKQKKVQTVNFDIFSEQGIAELSAFIHNNKPDYIIDCLPVGNILVNISKNKSLERASKILFDYFRCLQQAFNQGVKRIQKVSSGGAGGLGISCPYRHGLSTGASSDLLLWKVYFNGALHQLLINLHESAGASVGLTIPRALIGYETTKDGHIVGCGDGTLYTRTELELCAGPSQFGFITKEDVANAVLSSLFSVDFSHDLIHYACTAGVNQTQESTLALHNLTEQMDYHEQQQNIKLISLGSLGNQVTKDMIELTLAIEQANGNFSAANAPSTFLLSEGFYPAEVLNHFSFIDGPAPSDRQINFGSDNLNQWQAQAHNHTVATQLNYKDVGRILAAIYQHRGIDKK